MAVYGSRGWYGVAHAHWFVEPPRSPVVVVHVSPQHDPGWDDLGRRQETRRDVAQALHRAQRAAIPDNFWDFRGVEMVVAVDFVPGSMREGWGSRVSTRA
jgi:hypothetical protein